MKVAVITLGCPKNLVDTEVMLGILSGEGHSFASEPGCADVVIVNTCSFISAAIAESRAVVDECIGLKRDGGPGRVIVAGCLPQRFAEVTWEMFPGVDGVVGCSDFERIDEAVEKVAAGDRVYMVGEPSTLYDHTSPRVLGTPGHLAYVKIAEGCVNRCAYCTIPSIRGRLRSRSPESVVEEVADLVGAGVKEVNLIAQDTTAYGTDIAPNVTLARLITELSNTGAPWIRILYTHPAHVTDELLRAMADEAPVVPYIDVPIQHISDRILADMGRSICGDEIRRLFERVRDTIPDVEIRSSVMVGFPGETEREFLELAEFLRTGSVDHLGVFEYSPEPGTRAAEMPSVVEGEVASARARELIDTMSEVAEDRGRRLEGRETVVLVDGSADGQDGDTLQARTTGQAWETDGVVLVTGPGESVEPGDFISVVVTGSSGFDLTARRVDA